MWAKDVQFALRMMVKNPLFAIMIIMTLALGVGVNTAIFSVVNFILFRPLPVANPSQIMVMAEKPKGSSDFSNVSYPDFLDFREQSNGSIDLAAYQLGLVGLSSEGKPERAVINYVTGNFFPTLGVGSEVGRVISPEEGAQPGSDPVIVLGYAYWQRRFHGDPGIVGKTITANGHALTVVGVAENRFHGPYSVVETDAYLPLSMSVIGTDRSQFWTNRDNRNLKVLGRLKSGVSRETAQSSLNLVTQRLAKDYPSTNSGLSVRLIPEKLARPEPSESNPLPVVSTVFLALAVLVLLVACVNVANILMVRSISRQRELAVRTALGASRGRLIRQSVTESLILSAFGGLGGVLLGIWACGLLESIRLHVDFPIRLNFSVDWKVFAYALGLALLSGVLVGIIPAIRAFHTNINENLHQSSTRGSSSGAWQRRLRGTLVIGQIGMSAVLLIIAGLFVHSLRNAQQMYLGFNPDHLLNMSMDLHQIGYDEVRGKSFFQELESRVRSLPGVESASFSFSAPFGYVHESARVNVEGQPVEPDKRPPEIIYNTVDPYYFDNLQIHIVAGRQFTENDNENAPQVAIVNETMAKRFWPKSDPLGKRFSFGTPGAPLIQIVGIAKDGKYVDPTDEARPYFFVPLAQRYASLRTLQIRTAVQPEIMVPQVEQLVRSIAPDLPVFDARSMKDALNGLNGFFLFRLGAALSGTLGGLGLILAVVGIYGVISYTVTQRRQEIGIRMAMGAQRSHILKIIMRQALVFVVVGLFAGLLLALLVGFLIQDLLVGTSAADPVTFMAVIVLLASNAFIASLIPALRALRTDPIITLKAE